ncbi:ATP synthase subunit I [Curvibacter sp. CHRR-16]|uniref:ATP synthase subunit I n=1 Tax=Curvibacter sp. CHRR-16 TaxID=2835872 RepID=UPI001BDB0240|nr:ATP synthase subunit I [Curvibacter sp. CHRR-16]MBT0571832.1 ATP synthase subunit I [Curvibacter sp. CHRR-16]
MVDHSFDKTQLSHCTQELGLLIKGVSTYNRRLCSVLSCLYFCKCWLLWQSKQRLFAVSSLTHKKFNKQQWLLLLLIALALMAWLFWSTGWVASLSYGVLCCLVPSLFALRIYMRYGVNAARRALVVVVLCELVKVFLTVLALFAAKSFLNSPNWLVVVAGFVFGQMLGWAALWFAHVAVFRS